MKPRLSFASCCFFDDDDEEEDDDNEDEIAEAFSSPLLNLVKLGSLKKFPLLAKASISSTVSGRAFPAVSGSHNPDQQQLDHDGDYEDDDDGDIAVADQEELLAAQGWR